jgi:2-keto-3-deoxy-6-phosphogluconate aldolase
MALRHWGFIFLAPGLRESQRLTEIVSPQCKLVAVGVEKVEDGVGVAKAMLDDGVQLIELCGAFNPKWTGRIIEAVRGRIPVGTVTYSNDATAGLAQIFNGADVDRPHRPARPTGSILTPRKK